MQMPEVGQLVEVVLDDSFVHNYLADDSKHLARPTITIRGVVIDTPAWMRQHAVISLLNLANEARCHIPAHRIVSIGGVKFDQKPVTSDRVFEVISSKTGEKYHVVQSGRTKKWSCTCVGYQFHNRCRHIARLAEAA